MTPAYHLSQLDAVEWLRTLADESVDLIVTDPAYESLEKHRAKGTTTRLKHSSASSNDWFPIFPNTRFAELFAELYRVLATDRHLYVMCDQETMFVAKPIGEAAGFRFWKPLVWDKGSIGMGYHYRSRYEMVLFFEKGKRRLANLGTPDVLGVKRVTGKVCDRCARGERAGSPPRVTSNCDSAASTSWSTSSYGRAPTGPSLPGCKSTTRTTRSETIGSRTSSSSIQRRTSGSIPAANSETASGGSPVTSAESLSPSPSNTGTSAQTGVGQYLESAASAPSGRPSKASGDERPGVCSKCGARTRPSFPTEKPETLSRVLIEQSSAPGEIVIDPFMGSASVGAAALSSGRHFLGTDVADSALTVSRAWLGEIAGGDADSRLFERVRRREGQMGLFGGLLENATGGGV